MRKLAESPAVLLIALLLSLCGQCKSDESWPVRLEVSETPLGDVRVPQTLREHVQVSPDCNHLAYVDQEVFLDGVAIGKPHGSVAPCLQFSPDSRHIGWVEYLNPGYCILIDGNRGPVYSSRVPSREGMPNLGVIRYAPDGKRCHYLGTEANRPFVVEVDLATRAFHPLERNVYRRLVSRGGGVADLLEETNRWRVRTGGATGEAFDEIGPASMQWSADGKHLVYVARQGKQSYVVVDGFKVPVPEGIRSGPGFSPDGRRINLVTSSRYDDSLVIRLSGTKAPPQQELIKGPWTFAYSADGRRVARWSFSELFVDEKPHSAAGEVRTFSFAPDSNHFAFWIARQARSQVFFDDKPGTESEFLTPLLFSSDGRHLAYVACQSRVYRVVLDGNLGLPFADIRYDHMAISPDGRHVAYQARREMGARAAVIVVDDQEIAVDNDMSGYGSTLVFDGPNRLHTVAYRDKKAVRLDIQIVHERKAASP